MNLATATRDTMSTKGGRIENHLEETFSSSQGPSRVSMLIQNLQKSKYPINMLLKFLHLLVLDILNIVFCALTHYKTGIAIHASLTGVHFVVFGLDFFYRKYRSNKKARKNMQLLCDIVYYVCAYACLMGFLSYLCNYVRSPANEYSTSFPSECLGQSFENPEPIATVCRRLAPRNPYHYDITVDPVGFIAKENNQDKNLINEVGDWLDYQDREYVVLSRVEDGSRVQVEQAQQEKGYQCLGYMLVQLQTPLGFVQDMMIMVIGQQGSTAQVQSQLRLGLKDYGANEENVNSLIKYFKDVKGYQPIYGYPNLYNSNSDVVTEQ